MYVAGDTVIVEVTLTGTHTGPLHTPTGEIPPTGKLLRLPEVQIVEMRNGKAAVLQTYFDRMEMMGSLDHSPLDRLTRREPMGVDDSGGLTSPFDAR